jgi:hypothetical protein
VSDDLLTQADYERRGVSRQAVTKVVANKKIPVRVRQGRKVSNLAEADSALGLDQARLDVTLPAVEPSAARSQTDHLTAERTRTERYRAKMAQLAYRQKTGELATARRRRRGDAALRRCADPLARPARAAG